MISKPENQKVMEEFFATNSFDKPVDWKTSAEAVADPDDEEASGVKPGEADDGD